MLFRWEWSRVSVSKGCMQHVESFRLEFKARRVQVFCGLGQKAWSLRLGTKMSEKEGSRVKGPDWGFRLRRVWFGRIPFLGPYWLKKVRDLVFMVWWSLKFKSKRVRIGFRVERALGFRVYGKIWFQFKRFRFRAKTVWFGVWGLKGSGLCEVGRDIGFA